ncbi:MAG TPA: hypothetical protein VFK48_14105, partial [Usitatibacter sp.]|nr:hypothetical protein [Usitatibacter sp.]
MKRSLGRFAIAAVLVTPGWVCAQPTPSIPIARDLPQFQRHELRRIEILGRLGFFGEEPLDQCVAPAPTAAADIDVHRSLFVHDRATLDADGGALFPLAKTLQKIADQVNAATGASAPTPPTTALSIFRQLWDTQAVAPGAVPTPSSPHCDDNGGTVNGFPNACRPEAAEAADATPATMNAYRIVAAVNRIDLAHEGWRNCGEYRLIYAKPENGIQRNLVIFEAVLPNPKPGCREGCMDVARFWRDLSANADPVDRGRKLEKFFYEGLTGFRPVVHVDHYSAKGVTGSYGSSGSGQIRTNQFLGFPWILKEFKTVIDCGASPCRFDLVPIMVKVNPHGELWNEDIANGAAAPMNALAQAFQAGVLNPATLDSLGNAHLLRFGYSVDLAHDAAQSISLATPGFKDNYRDQLNAATGATTVFRTNLAAAATARGLTSNQMVNRAMAQSCAGCHKPGTFGLDAPGSIGPTITPAGTLATSWPLDAGFVHVDTAISAAPLPEFGASPAFGSGLGNAISPALRDFFLPDRKNFLLAQLNAATCECVNRFRSIANAALRERAIRIQRQVDARLSERVKLLRHDAGALAPSASSAERA